MAVSRALFCAGSQLLSSRPNRLRADWRKPATNSRADYGLRSGFGAASCRMQSVILFGRSEGRCGCARTLPLVRRDYQKRRKGAVGGSKDLRMLVPYAAVTEDHQPEPVSVQSKRVYVKDFLEDLKTLGRVRLIVNTGVAVLETVTSLEKLCYHCHTRGEYANLLSRDDNVDFHLLLEKVAAARLVKGKSTGMEGDRPTYMVRLVDVNDAPAVTILVMWKLGTDGDYDPGQVDGFKALVEKYGKEIKFLA